MEPKQSAMDRLRARMQQGVSDAMQYGKDVVTGKKLMSGLAQNDGTLDQWIAHGATEIVNVGLHGHSAPVYARSNSPADQSVEQMEAPSEATLENAPQPSVTSHGPAVGSSELQSSLGDLVDRLQATVPNHEPEMEMNR